jgi:hypothetical protein
MSEEKVKGVSPVQRTNGPVVSVAEPWATQKIFRLSNQRSGHPSPGKSVSPFPHATMDGIGPYAH